MPWTVKDARQKNSSLEGASEARMWVRVANTTLAQLVKRGVDKGEAEARAIRAANSAVRQMHSTSGGRQEATDMPVLIQEYTDSRGLKLAVDAEKGVIEGVKVLGLQSANGRVYPKETIARAVPLYEGAKVNINHPARPGPDSRDYRDRIGTIHKVRVEQGDGGLRGDFHFNPKHPLAEQLVWDAQHAPENVGLSHNVGAVTRRRNGQEIVEEITQVISVDLVADPATTQGLFENTDSHSKEDDDMADLTMESLTVERPDLIEKIEEAAITKHVNSEGEKAKQAEQSAKVESMTEELAKLKAKDAATEREAAIEKLLTEAKLPEAVTTEDFLKTVKAMETDAAKQLIEHVQAAYKVAGGKPQSQEQNASDATIPKVTDGKSLVEAIT